jgi:UDP-GlcNAc3NAcA epimerase
LPHSLLTIVGARPQFIKAALLSEALAKRKTLNHQLIHTGQHYDFGLSQQFFDEFDLETPVENLGVGGLSHVGFLSEAMVRLEPVIEQAAPSAIIVIGDTNSTLAGAMAAAKMGVPLIHIEAGLRSRDPYSPEEVNRVVTDRVSRLRLAPTPAALDTLIAEGLEEGSVWTGDLALDATLKLREALRESPPSPAAGKAIVTLHRQENTDDRGDLFAALEAVNTAAGSLDIVCPMHPRFAKALETHGLTDHAAVKRMQVSEPWGYRAMQRALMDCALIITDSGGLQREAAFHETKCVTVRPLTEWPETIDAGWNRLASTPDWITPERPVTEFGAGQAREAIADSIEAFLGSL